MKSTQYMFYYNFKHAVLTYDRPCGLVIRVPGYTSRDPGFDFWRYQTFLRSIGSKKGPLSLVRSYLDGKVAAPGLKNRD
jgi:hypothetical protein